MMMVALTAATAVLAAMAALATTGTSPAALGIPPPFERDLGPPFEVECGWLAPVDGPIVDGFRPPDNPFGPGGNRGIEYGTEPGDPVRAVAEGRVSFVGPVGGDRWLVITHDDGLRSTYGPLVTSSVVFGEGVRAGAAIARADAGLHLTARAGERYLDPAPLLDGSCGRARLVAPSPGSAP
ncbi:MAG: M23 family metallopeptidase [Acidimicrobiia bacterium]|nr:M23 family metallopeptidase [Acidimicrobiia bacterium]